MSNIKAMIIRKILEEIETPSLELVSQTLDWEIPSFKLEQINWEEYPYKPRVTLRLAYNENELFAKFKVREQSVRAVEAEDNGRMWEDSCVELFLSPDGKDSYYNLEITCIGKKLMGYRADSSSSIHATQKVLDTIRVYSSLGRKPFAERQGETEWNITIAIPFKAFYKSDFRPLSGDTIRGNFYKCGDLLTVPHFVSWQKIESEKPNFHLPQYFGDLTFE